MIETIISIPTPFLAIAVVGLYLLYLTLPRVLGRVNTLFGWFIFALGACLAYKMYLIHYGLIGR